MNRRFRRWDCHGNRQLAAVMLELQDNECHNLNLITPSHVIPQILAALEIAVKAGLNLPLVFNSNGYDSVEILKLLDGVVDFYIPDMRFSDPAAADRYLRVVDYVKVNRAVVKEMHIQVGDLIMDDFGVAKHGLMIRYLVLPRNLAGTEDIARYLAKEISATRIFTSCGGISRALGGPSLKSTAPSRIRNIMLQ